MHHANLGTLAHPGSAFFHATLASPQRNGAIQFSAFFGEIPQKPSSLRLLKRVVENPLLNLYNSLAFQKTHARVVESVDALDSKSNA